MSDTEDEDSDAAHYHLHRKQRRKTRRQSQGGGEQPPIIRGLWVQEVDWLKSADGETTSSAEMIPPPPQFTDPAPRSCDAGCGRAGVCDDVTASEDTDDASSADDRGGSDSQSVCTHESDSEDSSEARESNLTSDLMHVSDFNSSSCGEWDSDSAGCVQSLLGVSDSFHSSSAVAASQCSLDFDGVADTDTVLDNLRGRVARMPKLSAAPFFRGLIKQTLSDWKTSRPVNEGLIFHHVRHFHLYYILFDVQPAGQFGCETSAAGTKRQKLDISVSLQKSRPGSSKITNDLAVCSVMEELLSLTN